MNSGQRDLSILKKIVAHCDEIADTIVLFGNSRELLEKNKIYKNAVSMPVLQIGELSGHLSESFRGKHHEMPWRDMKTMRNIAAHDYENFDLITLWNTICNDIPSLRSYCQRIIEQHEAGAK